LEAFWGEHDEESARNCLNTTLWRLRRVLEPPGVPRGIYLTTTSCGEIGFNDQSPYWLDVEELERHASAVGDASDEALKQSDVIQLEEAVRLYTGDVLEGVYDDWALRERERLRALYLNSLVCLMRYHATHGAPERGIAHAEEILRHDPLREEIHRELMRMQVATGARAQAARQYDVCKRALAEELGVDPMPETQALLATIKRGTGPCATVSNSAAGDVNALARELQGAAQSVERALTYLRDVVGRVEQALGSPARR
jgi:DNA-binding SARP family transcriptional activator